MPTKPKGSKSVEVKTNGWDVLIKFLDIINDLFKTGNIFGAVLLLLFLYLIFVTYKLPPENVNTFILLIINLLSAEKYYIFPIGSFLSVSLVANFVQHKYYTREINRLVQVRTSLVHGIEKGELGVIPEHSSSKFNIDDTN